MNLKLKHILRCLGLQPKYPPSSVFVSLNVLKKRKPGLSAASTKAVIKISIWSCIFILLSFLAVYTILLAYVDKTLYPSISVSHFNKKIKLQGRFSLKNGHMGAMAKLSTETPDSLSRNKTFWNSSTLYQDIDSLPQCKWQMVFRILVTSAAENSERRDSLRKSWCDPTKFPAVADHAWHCIFLIGKTENKEENAQIIKEKEIHKDILIGNYIDSYRNLTLKVIHGFNWSANYCPSSYIIKTDDDCFVNAGLVHDFLLHYNEHTSGLYAGSVLVDPEKLKVIRGDTKRWSVSYKEYPSEYYPPYASGMGYILSLDIVKQLVVESQYVPPFANEDAYVGVVLSRLSVKPVSSSRFVLSPSGLSACNYRYVFVVHGVENEQQSALLTMTLDAAASCNHSLISSWN
ncbi:beta-1,3-galactosyltransferase 5-like [Biomphalaria glabrata]|uniref:Hexosyltransferase n=1 Tax=Biomphalaria glabrata TaxID=6526 RepID=A0A2C9JHM9_BIOGL|nr:beta-1,3-galactosyltransferase 5-like [Biomphalaria glabrata]XP_055885112.1 beta-1,3-galactosyltransferase 5-like [Biomphalaria glabrata]XP_055885113.1 beta-1,3-galactosyltransferase 5-like [Biomphalaria glabrata]XP_055885115.1 beta-1,3-galactosyltransferase 5-like [Biomphalaria glabrata]